ncbi:MAG: hypothetical protein Q8P18_34395 [Pseudomonadota bacterium]|nr:hypothetical protein [Pseudomonadota bacterium]
MVEPAAPPDASPGAAVTVRFHRSLYATPAVSRAAERFAAFGPAVIEATGPAGDTDILVTFSSVPDRLRDRLPDEFANHALFQTIVDARAALSSALTR